MACGYHDGEGIATHSGSMSWLHITWMCHLDLGPACCCGHREFLNLELGVDGMYSHGIYMVFSWRKTSLHVA